MDLVGSIGYHGQKLYNLDHETFVYVSGNNLCIFEPNKGPHELLIKQEKGISAVAIDTITQKIAISSLQPGESIDILSYPDQIKLTSINHEIQSIYEHLIFSRLAEYTCAIGGYNDHQLVLWNTESGVLLASQLLDHSLTTMCFNPLEKNQLFVYGKSSFMVMDCKEILDKHYFKIRDINITKCMDIIKLSALENHRIELSEDCIQFVVWIPIHRVLIGLYSGHILEVDMSTNEVYYRGVLVNSEVDTECICPMTCTLSMNHLIVGTNTGKLYWYDMKYADLIRDTLYDNQNNDMTKNNATTTATVHWYPSHSRMLSMSPITSLIIDNKYETIYAGCNNGNIVSVDVEIPVKKEDSTILNEDSTGGAGVGLEDSRFDMSASESQDPDASSRHHILAEVKADMQEGAVLVSTALSVPLVSVSTSAAVKKTSNVMNFYITGSHLGKMVFWKQPLVDSDTLTAPATIRKTILKSLVIAKTVMVSDKSSICAMITAHTPVRDGCGIIAIGTVNGRLEIFRIDAIENEEEEDEEDEEEEDEDGEGREQRDKLNESFDKEKKSEDTIKICIKRVCVYHLFKNALSLLSKPEESCSVYTKYKSMILAGSYYDNIMYVLVSNNKESYEPVIQLTLNPTLQPTAVWWLKDALCLGTYTGEVCTFSMQIIDDTISAASTNITTATATQMEASHTRPDHTLLPSLNPTSIWHLGIHAMIAGVTSKVSTHHLIVSADDMYLRYFIDNTNTSHPNDSPQVQLVSLLQDCRDYVCSCAISTSGILMALGCADGSVNLYNISKHPYIKLSRVFLHTDAIVCMAFSADNSQLLTCSIDGSFIIYTVGRAHKFTYEFETAKHSTRPMKFIRAASISGATGHFPLSEALWVEENQAKKAELDKFNYKEQVQALNTRVDQLRTQMNAILENQANADELDKLPIDELVIDINTKEIVDTQNLQAVYQTKELYTEFCMINELQAARIRDHTVKTMETCAVEIMPFFNTNISSTTTTTTTTTTTASTSNTTSGNTSQYGVSSFSIPGMTDQDKQTLHHIRIARVLELRTRALAFQQMNNAPDLSWLFGDCLRQEEPVDPTMTTDGNSGPGTAATATTTEKNDVKKPRRASRRFSTFEDDYEIKTYLSKISYDNIKSLLYHPTELHTVVQKRSQILMLNEVVRNIKKAYNQQFQQLLNIREDTLTQVYARNDRIIQIMNELGLATTTTATDGSTGNGASATATSGNHSIAGDLNYDELGGEIDYSMIYVDPSECINPVNDPTSTDPTASKGSSNNVTHSRSTSPRMRDTARGETMNTAASRALEDMMNGSLQVTRNLQQEASQLDCPDWMTKLSISEMTEAQVTEYNAYLEKKKQLEEDQAKYRKMLDIEMKKLKAENIDSLKVFDDKIRELSLVKVEKLKQILTIELFMCALSYNLIEIEEAKKRMTTILSDMEKIRAKRIQLREYIDILSAHAEEKRQEHALIQEEEKTFDKYFKRDIQALCNVTYDQETLKVLNQMFRIRAYPSDPDASDDEYEDDEDYGDGDDDNYSQSDTMSETASRSGRRLSSSRRNSARNSSSRMHASRRSSRSRGGKGRASQLHRSNSQHPGGKSTMHGNMRASRSRMNSRSGSHSHAHYKSGQQMHNSKVGGGGGAGYLGPMQEAAQAMQQVEAPVYDDRDPFYQALMKQERMKRKEECILPILNVLRMDVDCPDGFHITQFTFSKLQELRTNRIKKEIESKQMYIYLQSIRVKLEELKNDDTLLLNQLNEYKASHDQELVLIQRLEHDYDVMIWMKQGQDEVSAGPDTPNYHDAIFIPTSVITKFNTHIKALSDQHIQLLDKMMHYRRKISYVDWETKRLSLLSNHLNEYYTDLQMFRVTRQLQKILREGSSPSDVKQKLDKTIHRKEFIDSMVKSKREGYENQYQAALDKKRKEAREIESLELQVVTLQKQAEDHHMIEDVFQADIQQVLAMNTTLGGTRTLNTTGRDKTMNTMMNTTGNTKTMTKTMNTMMTNTTTTSPQLDDTMKYAVLRSQYTDRLKKQQEEIEYLESELKKMRDRTFPTFVNNTTTINTTYNSSMKK